MRWRARACSGGQVLVEHDGPGGWEPARVLSAEEAEALGHELRRAAQEARRRLPYERLAGMAANGT